MPPPSLDRRRPLPTRSTAPSGVGEATSASPAVADVRPARTGIGVPACPLDPGRTRLAARRRLDNLNRILPSFPRPDLHSNEAGARRRIPCYLLNKTLARLLAAWRCLGTAARGVLSALPTRVDRRYAQSPTALTIEVGDTNAVLTGRCRQPGGGNPLAVRQRLDHAARLPRRGDSGTADHLRAPSPTRVAISNPDGKAAGAANTNGARIMPRPDNGTAGHRWRPRNGTNGNFRIHCGHGVRVLILSGTPTTAARRSCRATTTARTITSGDSCRAADAPPGARRQRCPAAPSRQGLPDTARFRQNGNAPAAIDNRKVFVISAARPTRT